MHNISHLVTLCCNVWETVTYLTLLFSLEEPRKSISSGPEENWRLSALSLAGKQMLAEAGMQELKRGKLHKSGRAPQAYVIITCHTLRMEHRYE
jgi:hypothetical protein